MVANVANILLRILSLCLRHERVRLDEVPEQAYVDARPREEEDVPLEVAWVVGDVFAASQQGTLPLRSVLEILTCHCFMNAKYGSTLADTPTLFSQMICPNVADDIPDGLLHSFSHVPWFEIHIVCPLVAGGLAALGQEQTNGTLSLARLRLAGL